MSDPITDEDIVTEWFGPGDDTPTDHERHEFERDPVIEIEIEWTPDEVTEDPA